jgi:hypothetical protein
VWPVDRHPCRRRWRERFQSEGVARRADDQVFRYTYYSRSTRGSRWEDRDASIIVTARSVFVHKNGKVGLDLTPASRKENAVRREGDRVVISSGSGPVPGELVVPAAGGCPRVDRGHPPGPGRRRLGPLGGAGAYS